MKITFAGSPKYAAIVLEEILNEKIPVKWVVTNEDKPEGRGQKIKPTPVKKLARKRGLEVCHRLEAVIKKTDLVLVAAYGRIFSEDILEMPKYGFLNLHPSLLPKYRGPTPIQAAILNNDKSTGVTVIRMNSEIDSGPIISQKKINLSGNEYYPDLEKKLAREGGRLLADTTKKWTADQIEAEPQNDSEATYTRLLKKEDGRIDWSNPAEKIEREVRAYYPWPGCYTELDDKILKIHKASVQKQTEAGPFGVPGKTYLGTNEKIAVQTGKDFLLIEELQFEGGKKISSASFLQGNTDLIGEILN